MEGKKHTDSVISERLPCFLKISSIHKTVITAVSVEELQQSTHHTSCLIIKMKLRAAN